MLPPLEVTRGTKRGRVRAQQTELSVHLWKGTYGNLRKEYCKQGHYKRFLHHLDPLGGWTRSENQLCSRTSNLQIIQVVLMASKSTYVSLHTFQCHTLAKCRYSILRTMYGCMTVDAIGYFEEMNYFEPMHASVTQAGHSDSRPSVFDQKYLLLPILNGFRMTLTQQYVLCVFWP